MARLTDQQIKFVTTYIGVALQHTAGETGKTAATAGAQMPVWQQAKDTIDAQLQRLSDTLRKSGDPDVAEVAEEVASLLQPVRVSLVGPLMEFDKTPGANSARDGALSAIGTARSWLDSDPRVAAVDENPWGIPVAVAATLGEALDRIERNLASQQGVTG